MEAGKPAHLSNRHLSGEEVALLDSTCEASARLSLPRTRLGIHRNFIQLSQRVNLEGAGACAPLPEGARNRVGLSLRICPGYLKMPTATFSCAAPLRLYRGLTLWRWTTSKQGLNSSTNAMDEPQWVKWLAVGVLIVGIASPTLTWPQPIIMWRRGSKV